MIESLVTLIFLLLVFLRFPQKPKIGKKGRKKIKHLLKQEFNRGQEIRNDLHSSFGKKKQENQEI